MKRLSTGSSSLCRGVKQLLTLDRSRRAEDRPALRLQSWVTRPWCLVLGTFILLAITQAAKAGVTVKEDVAAGATSWPGSPIISTLANPFSTSVMETFTGSGQVTTNIGETFTVVAGNFTLQTIDLYAGGGSGTGAGTNLVLRLFDLGAQTAPNPSSYVATAGPDLLGSGAGLSVSYTNQANGILEFDFTGSDQVSLTNGHMYAFELAGINGTLPVYWWRTTNDTYSGGAAYRNQGWINNNSARDFALAVYGTGTNGTITTNPPVAAQCTVDWNDVHQRIDGFGGGVVFLNPGTLDPVTDANMDTLFLTNNTSQLGLTLLRIRIDPSTNWANALSDAQKAVARGAGVFATPWTPPASMKDNGNTVEGSLLPSEYADYASYLNSFAAYLASNGAPLKAISIQNEPDANVTYESCVWTGAELQTFCDNNASAITGAPVVMPESESFDTSFSDPTLNDPVAAQNVSIIAGHLYGVTTIPENTNALAKGKPVWMTEYLVNDQTWSTALVTAQQIHDCLTIGNMSAYIWWKALGDANGVVNASGVPQKRGFVMSQFSRFVRPGYYRIGVTNNNGPVQITAYKDLVSGNFALVAINPSSNDIAQVFNLANFGLTSLTPWQTSATLSLSSQTPITISGSSFTNTIPASSVVTLFGQAVAVPALSASRTGNNLLLSWPTNASAFQLEFAPALVNSNWTPVPGNPTTIGGLFVSTNSMTNGAGFYRLRGQ
jgi:glucuronoarabinoxylan endo-1,4-beta-xylanase